MGWLIFFRISFIAAFALAILSSYKGDTAGTILACFTAWYVDRAAEIQQASMINQADED